MPVPQSFEWLLPFLVGLTWRARERLLPRNRRWPKLQLDHVNIHVHDLAAAREFCVRLLGLEVGWRPSFAVPGDWLYLDGRPVIHTWLKSQERGLGWVDHIAFGPCGDPDEKRADLQRLGYPFTEGWLIDTDVTQFFVSGPEGLKIELQCRRQDLNP